MTASQGVDCAVEGETSSDRTVACKAFRGMRWSSCTSSSEVSAR